MPIPFSRADDPEAREGPEADARRDRLRALGIELPLQGYRTGRSRSSSASTSPTGFAMARISGRTRIASSLPWRTTTPARSTRFVRTSELRSTSRVARRTPSGTRPARSAPPPVLVPAEPQPPSGNARMKRGRTEMRQNRNEKRQRSKLPLLRADAERLRRETADLRARAARAAERVS